MFGIESFKPWVGDLYYISHPKLLILGESRWDEEFTDTKIIEFQIDGGHFRAHTNFVQAVLGKRHWEEGYDPIAFGRKSIFYNYNTSFYPGRARIPPEHGERAEAQNPRMLRKMLEMYKPTHCIVWGIANWRSVAVEGAKWGPDQAMPGLADGWPYRRITIGSHTTLFSHVKHPSAGFSFARWSAVLSTFLMLISA
ncbi:MAG: hypothetical protein ABSA52_00210 [Candidatus Binatia bacterium]|jgi:hypothetical protein